MNNIEYIKLSLNHIPLIIEVKNSEIISVQVQSSGYNILDIISDYHLKQLYNILEN
jgi:hypothetical protein